MSFVLFVVKNEFAAYWVSHSIAVAESAGRRTLVGEKARGVALTRSGDSQ